MKKSGTLALFIIVFLVTGCKIQDLISRSAGEANKSESKKTETAKLSKDPREDIIAASKKFTEQDSFSAKMELNGAKSMNMEIEFVAPDKFHVKNSASMEFIIIGKETYLKSNGSWKKFPANLGESISSMRDAFTEEGMKSMDNIEFAGEDSIDGTQAFLYKYKGKIPKAAGGYDSKLWIGKENGLPLRIEVEYPNNPALSRMTTNYDYETKVSIESPIAK